MVAVKLECVVLQASTKASLVTVCALIATRVPIHSFILEKVKNRLKSNA
jgi:hypothetical protein